MRRMLIVAVIAIFIASCAGAADFPSDRTVNLNRPGVVKSLQREHRAHHRKIQDFLAGLFNRPDAEVPRWIETTFNARGTSYDPVLLTSDPPQRRLSFVLDNTRYRAVLTLTRLKPKIIPAD